MRRLTALLLALLVVLTACGETAVVPTQSQQPEATPPPAQERVFALGYDPETTLHPITGNSQVNLDLAGLVYEGLYELNHNFAAVPVLAQSAQPDESGLVWTVSIKNGVLFSDGTPLTADHVAASLRLALGSELYGARLSAVTAIRAVEDGVVITLSAPNGALPALLDIPVVLEQEEGAPLGTGRYRFATKGEELFLSVNANHGSWADLPYQTIPLRAISTADRRIAAFDSGDVTAVTTDFSSAYALGYSGSYETWDYPTTNLLYVGFQTTKGACASAEVRRACSLAFDRESVVQSLLLGHGDPTSLPVHPNHDDFDTGAAGVLDYDIQGAEELLAQAGYTTNEEDGLLYKGRTPLAVTLVVNRDSVAKQEVADYLARSLQGIGVAVTVQKLGWEEYIKALQRGSFDLYIGEVRLTGDFDITELLAGSLNYGGYAGETLPALLAARTAAQGGARVQAAARLWEELADTVPIAPLCFKRNSLLVRWGMVSDLSPTQGDPFYGMEQWQVVINKKIKVETDQER